MSVAAITMVRNEPDYLERWSNHYGRQIGFSNCYIIDQSSDDGSIEELESTAPLDQINILKYPTVISEEDKQKNLLSHLCADLHKKYDAIIFTEVDELLFVDPRYFKSLPECIPVLEGDYLNAIGFEVIHIPRLGDKNTNGFQETLHLGTPVSEQRRWVCFNSVLCKPTVMKRSFDWTPKLHILPPRFNHLYLMKLRFSDVASALLRITRKKRDLSLPKGSVIIDLNEGEWKRVYLKFASKSQESINDIDMNFGKIQALLEASTLKHEDGISQLNLNVQSETLWPIIDRFRGLF
jgi:hypothetical protein